MGGFYSCDSTKEAGRGEDGWREEKKKVGQVFFFIYTTMQFLKM